eukprot:TRINITY_DN330_c0_g5_i1.p1 TRINITY_DN330_c0_g5~~TRINITY_DN330_c0_g5_i1.p1  ORF type:complete len:367 (+),score=124.14 TRINITY_DN330_c0_g5_i1:87-1103(+)
MTTIRAMKKIGAATTTRSPFHLFSVAGSPSSLLSSGLFFSASSSLFLTNKKRSFFSSSVDPTTTTTANDTLRLNNLASTTILTPKSQLNFEVPVYSFKKDVLSTIALPQHVFGSPLRTDILHRVLLWDRAAMQQGTHKAKGRAEVSGSSKKIRPQKKQGTARAGNKRPPHFRGGGRVFGPHPRDHSFDLPKKVVKFGLRVGLSTKFAQEHLSVVDFSTLDSHKTKNLASLMKEHQWGSSILFVAGPSIDRPLQLAAANIPTVEVISMRQIRVYDILRRQKLIIDPKAIDYYSRYLNTAKELMPSLYGEEEGGEDVGVFDSEIDEEGDNDHQKQQQHSL